MSKENQVVVFDLDETLGYFSQLGIFCEILKKIKNNNLTQTEFNEILDLYPEFVRPNIISILNFLKYKKQKNKCSRVMIYTNNQGPKEWVHLIKNYFHEKLKYPLFDQIIAAFTVNGKIVEIGRTRTDKCIKDFIYCTKLPENTQICFIDDVYHPRMVDEKVYYINLKPYVHHLPFDSMLNKFTTSKEELDLPTFTEKFNTHLKNYSFVYNEKQKEEYEIDKIVTKKTMVMLQEFFNKNNPNCSRKSRKHTCLRVNHKTAKNKN